MVQPDEKDCGGLAGHKPLRTPSTSEEPQPRTERVSLPCGQDTACFAPDLSSEDNGKHSLKDPSAQLLMLRKCFAFY